MIQTLIGSNGAGKSTTLRTVSWVRPLTIGGIRFRGENISRVQALRRVEMGIR